MLNMKKIKNDLDQLTKKHNNEMDELKNEHKEDIRRLQNDLKKMMDALHKEQHDSKYYKNLLDTQHNDCITP